MFVFYKLKNKLLRHFQVTYINKILKTRRARRLQLICSTHVDCYTEIHVSHMNLVLTHENRIFFLFI